MDGPFTFTTGCDRNGLTNDAMITEAVSAATKSELVILALGENASMTGECCSHAFPVLPGNQLDMARAVKATVKPIIVLLFTERPLIIPELVQEFPCILLVWFGGQEAGHAMCDVISGKRSPEGRLPVCIPRATGQLPLYYAQKVTGRPFFEKENNMGSRYIDCPNTPLFPFGFGLTYTTFEYGLPTVNSTVMKVNGSVLVTVALQNTGKHPGTETVQLYIRDLVGSVTRPVKELKAFRKVMLEAGKKTDVTFVITEKDLAFWTTDAQFKAEEGDFEIYVGPNSDATGSVNFTLGT